MLRAALHHAVPAVQVFEVASVEAAQVFVAVRWRVGVEQAAEAVRAAVPAGGDADPWGAWAAGLVG